MNNKQTAKRTPPRNRGRTVYSKTQLKQPSSTSQIRHPPSSPPIETHHLTDAIGRQTFIIAKS